ncbi:DUF2267 domain-containing protein [Actinomadura gamaensis]|uniref:DUF2267 domain-containing protein n=1 Tax=Actinomadura gamaensis TaxID=1763541 RepID=A0ABV9TT74_9ACTN
MRSDEFLAEVRRRGGYADQGQAAEVARNVLGVLSERIPPADASHLAAQLPDELGEAVDTTPDRPVQGYGLAEFYARLSTSNPEQDAAAVLSTLSESVSGGEVNHLLSQLPSGYAVPFGKPDLAN